MQIRRFHLPELTRNSTEACLEGNEAAHALKVLRLVPGDKLQLFNGAGLVADAELLPHPSGARNPREAVCRILDVQAFPLPRELALFVAPPRGKAWDLVLKAAVELGFTRIQPFLSQYGVAKPDGCSDSWEQTLTAAMKQSANPWLPETAAPIPFSEALKAAGNAIFGASPGAEALPRQEPIREHMAKINAVFVGPEGGFSRREEEEMLAAGAFPITIGPAILRVETAVPALAGFLYGATAYNP